MYSSKMSQKPSSDNESQSSLNHYKKQNLAQIFLVISKDTMNMKDLYSSIIVQKISIILNVNGVEEKKEMNAKLNLEQRISIQRLLRKEIKSKYSFLLAMLNNVQHFQLLKIMLKTRKKSY